MSQAVATVGDMQVAADVRWAQAVSAIAASVQAVVTATAGVIAYRAYGVTRQSSLQGRVARLECGARRCIIRMWPTSVRVAPKS